MSLRTTLFAPLGADTAPEASQRFLEEIQKSFKFVPNLFGVFANSPALLEGYLSLSASYGKASLTATERELALLAASVENACRYCTAAHSTVLKSLLHLAAEPVTAVRSNDALTDQKLNALVSLTKEIVADRGHVRSETIAAFLEAGYKKDQILEILIGVALKTMSNYTHHISSVEIDPAFQAEGDWTVIEDLSRSKNEPRKEIA